MPDDKLDKKRSDDSHDTFKYVNGLIENGQIKIEDVLVFFNYGCGAYKEASRIILKSDAKINIEFNYAARAFASYISNVDEKEKKLSLLDAFQASRHIINDSLDLILGEIERLLAEANNISQYKQLDDYIQDYDELVSKKERIHEVVANSRRQRGMFRYEAYLTIIQGESYDELIKFLDKIKYAIRKLSRDRDKEQKENRKNLFLMILFLFLGAVIAFIIALFPEEIKRIGDGIKLYFYGGNE